MIIPTDIMHKIERFCAYQERCVFDVRRKLGTFRLPGDLEDAIIAKLIDEKFIDEERFVEIFVRSKVNSGWGRYKIATALKTKQIDDKLISKFCNDIDADSYREKISAAVEKWKRTHHNAENAREKLVRHLLSKGFSYQDMSEFTGDFSSSE